MNLHSIEPNFPIVRRHLLCSLFCKCHRQPLLTRYQSAPRRTKFPKKCASIANAISILFLLDNAISRHMLPIYHHPLSRVDLSINNIVTVSQVVSTPRARLHEDLGRLQFLRDSSNPSSWSARTQST
jgi:hypothetical protein